MANGHVNWEAVHDLVVEAGGEDSAEKIFRALLMGVGNLVPHDFAQLVVLGDRDPVEDPFARPYGIIALESLDVPSPHRDRYPYYFARTDLRPTTIPDRPILFQAGEAQFVGTEFGEDWCRPVKARHSAGMRFLDQRGRPKALVILYRERADLPFGPRDLGNLAAVHPHIVNLTRARLRQRVWDLEPTFARLSPRERQIVGLLCEGLPTKAIAWRLFISEATAARHAHNIYEKLAIGSRQELLALILKTGSGP